MSNPARVLRQQLKVVTMNEGSNYVPMKDISIGGIILVRSLKPGEEELVEPVAGNAKIFFSDIKSFVRQLFSVDFKDIDYNFLDKFI